MSRDTFDIAQMPNAEFQVHRAGCADDLSKGKYARANIMRITAGSLREIVLGIYPPDDFGYEPDRWEDYSGDLRVIGCAGVIP